MAKKKTLTPDEIERLRAALESMQHDVKAAIELLRSKLGEKPA